MYQPGIWVRSLLRSRTINLRPKYLSNGNTVQSTIMGVGGKKGANNGEKEPMRNKTQCVMDTPRKTQISVRNEGAFNNIL